MKRGRALGREQARYRVLGWALVAATILTVGSVPLYITYTRTPVVLGFTWRVFMGAWLLATSIPFLFANFLLASRHNSAMDRLMDTPDTAAIPALVEAVYLRFTICRNTLGTRDLSLLSSLDAHLRRLEGPSEDFGLTEQVRLAKVLGALFWITASVHPTVLSFVATTARACAIWRS